MNEIQTERGQGLIYIKIDEETQKIFQKSQIQMRVKELAFLRVLGPKENKQSKQSIIKPLVFEYWNGSNLEIALTEEDRSKYQINFPLEKFVEMPRVINKVKVMLRKKRKQQAKKLEEQKQGQEKKATLHLEILYLNNNIGKLSFEKMELKPHISSNNKQPDLISPSLTFRLKDTTLTKNSIESKEKSKINSYLFKQLVELTVHQSDFDLFIQLFDLNKSSSKSICKAKIMLLNSQYMIPYSQYEERDIDLSDNNEAVTWKIHVKYRFELLPFNC